MTTHEVGNVNDLKKCNVTNAVCLKFWRCGWNQFIENITKLMHKGQNLNDKAIIAN